MIPQLRVWHQKYHGAGLTIIGVHTPEFPWERARDGVVAATRRLSIPYPVVQDNDAAIWRRFGVRAWPTAVILDRNGVVRHVHIGEGAYAETERVIQALLGER